MAYIKKEKIEEIKSKADIVSVASDYISVKKSGRYYIANCPFHNEKTPSFFLYPETNTFHCFGCGKHGDSISFVMEMESSDYVDTIKQLAKKFNVELEYDTNKNVPKVSYDKYYFVNDFVAKFYYRNMMENQIPKQYLLKRGINQKSINTFLIGYAGSEWKALYNKLLNSNIDLSIAEELGLIIKTKSGEYVDRFRDRIIFPILNKNKQIIGFGGRTIVNDKAKYLNSPESVIFKKGDNLYSIDKFAENNLRDKILIVEGYMDVISLYQNGINFAVAGLGTAFTENQARLAKKFSRGNVYLCYDSDNAGINATNKTAGILKEISVNPNILLLPNNLDPDDYIRTYGLTSFNNLLENAIDINEFNYINLKNSKLNNESLVEKNILNEKILEFLSKIETNILSDLYINKISNEFGIDKNSLKEDLAKFDKNSIEKEENHSTNNINYISNTVSSMTNNDKKLLIMGIILLMKGNKELLNFLNEMKTLCKGNIIESILEFISENTRNNIVTIPTMLIDKFKFDREKLKIVEYIIGAYKENLVFSTNDYIKLLKISLIQFNIRIVTNNIEHLKRMDNKDENVVSNLNFNIEKLMELNKSLKNAQKGVYYE
ncbi:MAG: DNA primase [Peptoniphilaceae bacterium]|uniref:DNA primase n=1 Tax=Parvimonas sp. TaxID=1944660 RepID=UPI002A74CB1E|nr:DNA primase [Parvimonas sp.]MDD7764623.1 DNA primase [Peptoniphilaceae bacterium]MDY3050599.1 DNA primase [Parvimonas sp.]